MTAKPGIIRTINRVRVELTDALDRELAKFDISAAQLIVLASLANQEAGSASVLCKSISYDPGAMTRMIDRLQQKGLVRRVPNPGDRRAMNLEITAAGRALYPQLMPGGQLTLSANGDRDGIVWATVPIDGDANRNVVAGIVRAYDATHFDATPHPDGTPRLRLLWSATGFNYSKFCPPMVADGKVFVPTYDGRIDVYTLK